MRCRSEDVIQKARAKLSACVGRVKRRFLCTPYGTSQLLQSCFVHESVGMTSDGAREILHDGNIFIEHPTRWTDHDLDNLLRSMTINRS